MNSEEKKTILLVEDETIIAMNEKAALERYNYIVHHDNTGEKAIETIIDKAFHIDLILMDIDLGSGIDGTQAAEQILNQKDIPIVFLSSHTEPEVVEKTEKITSYGFVVKNSGIAVLDSSIKMALKLFYEKTTRKKAEKEIQKSENFTKALLNAIPTPVFYKDRAGNYLGCNQQFTEIMGVSSEQIQGKTVFDLWPGEHSATYHKKDLELMQNPQHQVYDFQIKDKDGILRPVIYAKDVFLDEQGKVAGIVGVFLDITEHKQIERQLQKAKDDLKVIYDNMLDLVAVTDMQGNYKSTGYSHRISGYEIDDLIGKNVMDFVHPEDLPAVKAEFEDFITNKKSHAEAIYRNRCADGSYLWFETFATLIIDENKKPKEILFNTRDITERKRAEGALRESEKRFHDLVALIPVGVYIVWIRSNGHMEFEYVSDRWCAIHGLRREDVMTDIAVVNNKVHPDDRESFLDHNREAARDRKPFNWEGRFLTGDGELRQLRIESTPIVLDNDDIRWFGVTQDITKRKQVEEKIKKQLTEKETLLREVHHRMKNNIATIESFLSLQAGSTANAEVKAMLQDAISRVQSMRVLYDKLLLRKELNEISIKNYVESFVDSLVMFFDSENKIIIEKHIADFEIDTRKAVSIGIIINELLTNVFKYAFKDSDKGTVSISIDIEEGNIILIIQDDGVGFDERVMANKSPGFGLTIVRMLVEQLEGSYSIGNENGARSVVQFKI